MRALSVTVLALAAAISGCSDDDDTPASGSGGMPATSNQSLCAKYGGADAVASVVSDNIIANIAADCRISAHFTELDADSFAHVGECLTIQVQDLFGCEGIEYAGAESSVGRECRSMADAHQGLGISKGDFDALIDDVVSGLSEAGVEEGDINAAAPALLGMEGDIVEDNEPDYSKAMCPMPETDAGGGSMEESLCDKYGGADAVAGVVNSNIIGTIAADCRISAHFTELSAPAFQHVGECLTIQVQELFGCEGVQYAGAESSVDRPCRSMTAAHQGLGISKGDFDALIEDVVTGLTEAGVSEDDIGAAAPALLGMEGAIVEDEATDATKAMCIMPDAGDAAP